MLFVFQRVPPSHYTVAYYNLMILILLKINDPHHILTLKANTP